MAAALGKLPKYMQYAKQIDSMPTDIYCYLNSDRMNEYTEQAGKINMAQLA